MVQGLQTPTSASPSTAPTPTTTLTPFVLETSLAVLRQIPPAQTALSLFLKHANPNDGWIRLAAQRILESLHSAFAPELLSADLPAMAQVIAANTARPWAEEDEPDAQRWLAALCGRNLRWEALGVLLTYWGFAALADNRPVVAEGSGGKRRATLVFKEAAQACVGLCRGVKQNSLLLYLMLKIGILESILSGDSSPVFWKNW